MLQLTVADNKTGIVPIIAERGGRMNRVNMAICAGWLLSMAAWAAPEPSSTPDYCDDPAGWQSMEGLLHSAPGDELVIKLYALRLGLCQMIKDKKIDTQAGIDLFETERQRAIDRRTLEEQQAHKRSAHPL